MENMDIQIIKSRRRTVSIEVHTDEIGRAHV